MNEQDKRLLNRYLKEQRRKKLTVLVIMIIIVSVSLYGLYKKFWLDESIKKDEISNSIINEKNTNEETITNIIITDTKMEEVPKEETKIQATKELEEQTKENEIESKVSIKEKKTKEKPPNKDFLFVDGYNIENVSQVAQEYLSSSGFDGQCIPLKDEEGIYLGVRVIFY